MISIIENCLYKLKEYKIPSPELDLKILIQEASINNKEVILSNINVEDIDLKYLNFLVSERLNRVPISKIINKKNFWKDQFFVNSHVLDPRPETELIIEEVLNITKDRSKKLKILDIGTGSGCLAISIAKELINSNVTAIDNSINAVEAAKKNIKLHNVKNQVKVINFKIENIEKLNNKFDIIISNPPYVKKNEYKKLDKEIIRYEPKSALIGGNDGLKYYRMLSKKIEKIMKKNSFFIFEIGYGQLDDCIKIFNNTDLILINVSKDLQNIDRTLTFYKI